MNRNYSGQMSGLHYSALQVGCSCAKLNSDNTEKNIAKL